MAAFTWKKSKQALRLKVPYDEGKSIYIHLKSERGEERQQQQQHEEKAKSQLEREFDKCEI